MLCPRCGSPVNAGKAFCSQCGQRLQPTQHHHVVITPKHPLPPLSRTTPQTEHPAAKPPQPVHAAVVSPEMEKLTPRHPKTSVWLLAILLVLAGCLSLGGVWAARGHLPVLGRFPFSRLIAQITGSGDNNLAALVPNSSAIFVQTVASDTSQIQKLNSYLIHFSNVRTWKNLLQKLLVQTDSNAAVTWDKDVTPWLGQNVGIIYQPPQSATGNWSVAYLLQTKDKAKTQVLINALANTQNAKQTTLTYRQQTYAQLDTMAVSAPPSDSKSLNPTSLPATGPTDTPPIFMAIVSNYYVVTDSNELMTAILDAHLQGGLDQNDQYTALLANAPGADFLNLYINTPALVGGLATPALAPAPLDSLAPLFKNNATVVAAAQILGPILLSAAADNQGVHLLAKANAKLNLLAPLGLGKLTAPFSPKLLPAIPSGTVLYQESTDFGSTLGQWIKASGLFDPTFAADLKLAQSTLAQNGPAFDWDADLSPHLDTAFAVAVTLENQTPGVSVIFKTTDNTAALAGADKLLASVQTILINTLNGANPAFALNSQTDYRLAAAQDGVNYKILRLPVLPERIEPSYGLVGDYLVISSTPSSFKAFADVYNEKRQNLLANTPFNAAYQSVPAHLSAVHYLDIGKLLATLSAFSPSLPVKSDTPLDLGALTKELLPLQGIFGFSQIQNNVQSVDNWLLLAP